MTPFTPTTEKVACVPLYAVYDHPDGPVDFLATGTLLSFRGRHLLASAAHVFDRDRKFGLLVAGPKHPLKLSRPALATPPRNGMNRQTDPLDFGVVEFEEEEAQHFETRCRFIEIDESESYEVTEYELRHVVMGYDAHSNPVRKEHCRLPANANRIDVMEDQRLLIHGHNADYKRHRHWYLGMRYEPWRFPSGKVRPKMKAFNGFSGGPIWRSDGINTFGFAGMVTECVPLRHRGEKTLFAVRARAIIDLLSDWF